VSDRFTLVARTNTKTSVPAAVNVKIMAVNDETPIIVNNTGIEVWAGGSATIRTDNLGERNHSCVHLTIRIH
jgi:hypothetical protein